MSSAHRRRSRCPRAVRRPRGRRSRRRRSRRWRARRRTCRRLRNAREVALEVDDVLGRIEAARAAEDDLHRAGAVLPRNADRQIVLAVAVEVACRERRAEEILPIPRLRSSPGSSWERSVPAKGSSPAGLPRSSVTVPAIGSRLKPGMSRLSPGLPTARSSRPSPLKSPTARAAPKPGSNGCRSSAGNPSSPRRRYSWGAGGQACSEAPIVDRDRSVAEVKGSSALPGTPIARSSLPSPSKSPAARA